MMMVMMRKTYAARHLVEIGCHHDLLDEELLFGGEDVVIAAAVAGARGVGWRH